MDSRGDNNYGDGLAFFLAPVGSSIRSGSVGSGLGLGIGNETANSSSDSFVAVEFDTYPNPFDPRYYPNFTHVGINLNSMVSAAFAKWDTNISGGRQNEAWIIYTASSRNLTVMFTNYSRSGPRQSSISYGIDLRDFLPEYVIVGFSASTGASFQTNNIKSWVFNSTNLDLGVVNNPVAEIPPGPAAGIPPNLPGPDQGKPKNTGLIVGLSVGLPLIILASAFAGCCLWKRKHKQGVEEVEFTDMDNEFEKGTGPKRFSYKELLSATSNFSEEEKLGEGGFGGVYRGWLTELGCYVAVKRVSQGSNRV